MATTANDEHAELGDCVVAQFGGDIENSTLGGDGVATTERRGQGGQISPCPHLMAE